MKTPRRYFFFPVVTLMAALAPLACLRPTHPTCALSQIMATPTVTSALTPNCFTQVITLPPFHPAYSVAAVGNSGTFVIHNLTDWQTTFPTFPVPLNVDFSTQMIVGAVMGKVCGIGPDLVSVCETSTQVTALVSVPTTPPPCYYILRATEMIIVPQSTLPVVWVTE
jgi:hypothetical protein